MAAGNQHRSGWALLPLVIILLMMLLAPLLAADRAGADDPSYAPVIREGRSR